MTDERKVFFVNCPDGTPLSASVAFSEDEAIRKAIVYWLPEHIFRNPEMGAMWGGGAAYYLWPAMERAGCKLCSFPIPDDSGVAS